MNKKRDPVLKGLSHQKHHADLLYPELLNIRSIDEFPVADIKKTKDHGSPRKPPTYSNNYTPPISLNRRKVDLGLNNQVSAPLSGNASDDDASQLTTSTPEFRSLDQNSEVFFAAELSRPCGVTFLSSSNSPHRVARDVRALYGTHQRTHEEH